MSENIGKRIQFIDNNKVIVGVILNVIEGQYYTIIKDTEYLLPQEGNFIIF